MFSPIGHGFGLLAGIFGAIVWAIGTFILLLIVIGLIVLLARFLWFGTKASQRYLELNGSPAPRVRTAPPATPAPATPATKAPAAAPRTTTAAKAPAAPTSTATKPPAKPRTPKP